MVLRERVIWKNHHLFPHTVHHNKLEIKKRVKYKNKRRVLDLPEAFIILWQTCIPFLIRGINIKVEKKEAL